MPLFGSLAQLVERHVYTVDVIGSIPVGPTTRNPVMSDQMVRQGGALCVRLIRSGAFRRFIRMAALLICPCSKIALPVKFPGPKRFPAPKKPAP